MSQTRDIVVIGASAGGIQALLAIVAELPAHYPGAIFVVVHTPPSRPSLLPTILERAGPLPAAHARHGEPIVGGRIYIAPPDHHLLVRSGYVEVTRGPRENHSRPAVDPLFRSAARAYGARVVGVVLSGALGDGSSGLMAIKVRGGYAIVQDPDEALVEGMPRSALQLVQTDQICRAAEIAPLVVRLAEEPVTQEGASAMNDASGQANVTIQQDIAEQARNQRDNELTLFTCPDCGGSLWQIDEGPFLRFQCHVGHAWGSDALMNLKTEELEAALWTCVRLLTEKATLSRQLATRGLSESNGPRSTRIEEQAIVDEQHAKVVRELIENLVNPMQRNPIPPSAGENGHGRRTRHDAD